MKNAYPIVMTQGKEFVVVFVPDFNINTQGKDIPDAIEMARDAIGLMGIDMQDDGEALPEASSIASAQAEAPSGAIVSLVDVDFAEYRRKNDMRVVKKNCTIPSWLNFEAERAGVNFSAVLQAALKKRIAYHKQIIRAKGGRNAALCHIRKPEGRKNAQTLNMDGSPKDRKGIERGLEALRDR